MATLAQLLHDLTQAQTPDQLRALLPRFDSVEEGAPSQVLFYRGQVQFKLQDPASLASFEQSIALDPAYPDAHLYYAVVVPNIGGITRHKALALQREHLKQALALAEAIHPAAPETWNNYVLCLGMYADVCSGIGPYAEIERAMRSLVRIEPNNASALERLATALINQGKANDVAGLTEVKLLFEAALRCAPDSASLQTSLDAIVQSITLMAANPRSRKIGRYPNTSDMQGDVAQVIRRYITNQVPRTAFITKQTRFTTMGSCFAAEISKKLNMHGYQSTHFDVSEFVNSTFANRHMVDWVMGECEGQVKERLDELFGGINISPAQLREYWTHADVLVYTLGVAPVFFERASGQFSMPKAGSLNTRALAERYEFRTTTVAENLENLEYIYARIRAINVNPKLQFVLTLSPVPLTASFEFESAMYADCLSKSTLRVVAHEFQKLQRSVLYWPSFEIVRWLGGHVGPYYGVDDGASWHISEDLIHVITDLFIEHFSAEPAQA